jgi:hypothetical protein
MAEQDFTTKSGKRWPLLGQIQDGPIKENLIEIQKILEKMEKVPEILFTLYNHAEETEHETITLANETVSTLAVMIDSNVDSVFYHLNQIFEPKPQAAPEGGAA